MGLFDFVGQAAGSVGNLVGVDVSQQAKSLVSAIPGGAQAFDVGSKLMQATGTTPDHLMQARAGILSPALPAFDAALALHRGQKIAPPAPPGTPPAAQAAYLITHGLQGAPPASKVAVVRHFMSHPFAHVGANQAIKQIANARAGWWSRFLTFVHLKKKPLAAKKA